MSFTVMGENGQESRVFCRVPFHVTTSKGGILGRDQRVVLHIALRDFSEGDRKGELDRKSVV